MITALRFELANRSEGEKSFIRMKKFFWFCCFIFSTVSAKSQYAIPGAIQQPAWVFPIWIENGDGQRDTLYIGFDSTASSDGWLPQDSIFGVRNIEIDSSKFNACWRYAMYADTALKVIVCSLNLYNLFPEPSVGALGFIHATYPLKFSWDVSLLRSDSLPFSSQPQAPIAQAEMYFEMGTFGGAYNNDSLVCSTSNTLLITDTTLPVYNYCCTKDSIRFQDIYNTPGAHPGYIIMTIKTWMGHALEINEVSNQPDLLVFPNPSTSDFNITIPGEIENEEIHLKLYNSVGQLIFETEQLPDNHHTIRFSNPFPSGLYFIEVKGHKDDIFRHLIIKQ